ncbi:HNH endonuclease [Solimicrobium silvestre]|nr:HNH endonuclease [Solimicrobium silvestre]
MNYRKIPDVAQKSAVRISEWVKKNPESTKAAQRRHAEKNREMRRQYSRLYQKEHRAQDAERSARQRAEIKRATPNWANLDYIAGIYELCALFRRTGLDWHVDHIIPINGKNVVGFHVENNLQILSAIKNISKGNRLNDLDGGCLLPA